MNLAWRIYDYKGSNGESAIQAWLDREKVSKRDRGQLNQKMDLLAMHGMDLPPKLLAGPLRSKTEKLRRKNIYKLIVHGDLMLRPYLCRGPVNNDAEFTMLLGVIERNNVNDHDPSEAEAIRESIIENHDRRKDHERYR
jgi:hypothetical protein